MAWSIHSKSPGPISSIQIPNNTWGVREREWGEKGGEEERDEEERGRRKRKKLG